MRRFIISTVVISVLIICCVLVYTRIKSAHDAATLISCEQDSDCVIVPYSSCCGSTKKAINHAYLSDYQSHPEWQKFQGSECAYIGVCPDDSKVKQAYCPHSESEKNGICSLKFPE